MGVLRTSSADGIMSFWLEEGEERVNFGRITVWDLKPEWLKYSSVKAFATSEGVASAEGLRN